MYKRLLFSFLLSVLFAGCAQEPRDTDIASVVALQQDYDGQLVRVEGKVRKFDDPLHYWVEDNELNRIRLTPDEAAADHVDQPVQVTGHFRYDSEEGRRMEVEELRPLKP